MCSRSIWHPYGNPATGRCIAFGCDGTFDRRGCAAVLIAGVALAAAVAVGLATDPTTALAALATVGVAR
jgi:hypothetical protein